MTIPEIKHWHPVTSRPPLPPSGLHLWKIPTGNGGATLADLSPLLSPRESDRSKKLRFIHHRERYVRAHAGLRKILAGYIKINPQDIEFKYGKAGKPLLDAPESGIEFNMTTSGDLALVAVSAREPVGVDCEQVRERISFTAIAKRMFAPDEAARIATARQDDRPKLFQLAWTALEAEVKADGRGLARHKESTAQGILDIEHCIPECGFIAAVARRYLPPVEEWMTLELAAS